MMLLTSRSAVWRGVRRGESFDLEEPVRDWQCWELVWGSWIGCELLLEIFMDCVVWFWRWGGECGDEDGKANWVVLGNLNEG